MLDQMKMKRVNAQHVFKPFDCGDQDLNDFLLNDSKLYLKNLLAVTYVLETESRTVAYFSVSNDKISVADTSKSIWRRLRRGFSHSLHRKDYPSVKVGRLAVDLDYQFSSIGTYLIEFIKTMFISRNRTGCAFITVDALRRALPFYLKNDFLYLEEESLDFGKPTIQLYLNLNRYRE